MKEFKNLISVFQSSIFSWDYFSDFKKVKENSFKIKVQLNILNSILWEQDIENKFLNLLRTYPDIREVLPILIAVRNFDKLILDRKTFKVLDVKYLFQAKKDFLNEDMLLFFIESWLKDIFKNKNISNLNDYVFWVETWLDSNARKNRTGDLMEDLVEWFIKDLCKKRDWFEYKEQATATFIKKEWWVDIESDKSSRRFDFAIYNSKDHKVYLIEVNYYWWWGSKLKAVAWEFSWLYNFMQKQGVPFYWITDGLWWNTAIKPLEEAYNKMEWNIYNIEMLKEWILNELIK